ncbi:MAG: tyrosine phenol-lyase [Candidatus Marinimicrobia bacterium]|nr:tyrosine phenol-lyase [Candidatus Neomarinimicrobiota bacterium]
MKKFQTVIEPFIIKSVDPIRMTSEKERIVALEKAKYNLFKIPAHMILIDLLTDSGTGAMSSEQWAAIMRGDESYAGSASFDRLEKTVKELFGFKHVIPAHQGRAAERILFSTICKKGDIVPNNTHFDTTRANVESQGATAIDLVIPEGLDPSNTHHFKGNMNIIKLEELIKNNKDSIPVCLLTITNNSGGGQPVSMENIRAVRTLLDKYGIPLYLDACRFAENAYFIKLREPQYKDVSVKDIVLEMMSLAEGCTISAKKDGLVNIGGLLCTNNDSLAKKEKDLLILTEGYPTYGGLAGRDLDAMAVGLTEVIDEDYLEYRIAQAKYLGEHLMSLGYNTIQPPGGHAIYIDAKSTLDHIPSLEFPGHALAVEFYKTGGIRSCEIGSVMFGTNDTDTGKEIPAKMELLRLALPRRTHTQSHIDYVLEVAKDVIDRKNNIRGLKIIDQPKALRHFSASFELL